MDWRDILGKIAPTVATALGGPAAGMAVAVLGDALGITESGDIKKLIEEGKLTGDQIAAIQQAEIAIKARAQELNLDFEKLAVDDRKSAREMQVATHSMVPPTIAGIIIAGYCVITALKISGMPMVDDHILQDLITTMRDGFILVLGFYFGSSKGSQNKDNTIRQLTSNDG